MTARNLSMLNRLRSVCAAAQPCGRATLVAVGLLMLSLTGCCEWTGTCPPEMHFTIDNEAGYAIQVKQQSGGTAPVTVANVDGGSQITTTSDVDNPQDFSVTIFVGGGPVYTKDHLAVTD